MSDEALQRTAYLMAIDWDLSKGSNHKKCSENTLPCANTFITQFYYVPTTTYRFDFDILFFSLCFFASLLLLLMCGIASISSHHALGINFCTSQFHSRETLNRCWWDSLHVIAHNIHCDLVIMHNWHHSWLNKDYCKRMNSRECCICKERFYRKSWA